ncbi:MAG: D-arabinono-1,4-lactone oxidase, partial [Thermomicrobiales bacterium]
LRVTRSEADFSGMVVHLGALGLVTRVTFDIQPTFEVSQEVLDDLPWEPLLECFTEIFSSAYSVSVFTTFGHDRAGSLWRKHRHSEGGLRSEETWGATPANEARHPVRGFASDPCTTQLMQAGPWCDRLPHFRIGAVPSAGQEIQVEYMIDIDHASEAVRALRAFEPRLRDVLIVSELRTIAADDLWLSTAYGRDSLAIHFTCHRDQAKIDALLPDLESLLEPFSPRPHWGKVFSANAETLASRYPKYGDFRQLRQQLDPRGAFINPFMERVGLA